MKFIKDEEIQNLNSNDDLLETKKYANTLKEVIINSKTPFTIGLFGEWGSGKSSIVNTAQNDLEENSDKKIKFIKYDAWKYANDSFRRMFLKTVQNELNIEGTSDFEAFYVDKNTTTKIDKKVNISFLVVSILIVLIGFTSVFFLGEIDLEWKITIPLLIVMIGMSVSIARNFFDSYKVTVQNPKIFAPEQFENIFDEMIDTAMSTTVITKPKKWIKCKFIENKIDKLVIIVDNIDRCDKETAYELLTNIKNFLEREGIVFVVPIDDSALRRHLKEKNNEDSKEADEFLRKFFNVNLKIKHFQTRDLFMFTNNLNKKHELDLQPDTVDIIAKEYASNPRRIIQLLNNLISELNIVEQKYDSDFIEEHESLIAKLLIIREEWACIYKQISNKPHILKKHSEIIFGEDSSIKDDVINFLTRTKAISENVDERVIEKLVSNIDNDLKISNEILDYIKNNEYNKVVEYIEDNEQFKELMYYLLKELETEITRETYKVGALNKFKNIIKLNELKEIPVEINKKLYRDTSEENILKVIENLSKDDFDIFYKFVDVNQKQKLNYLEKIAIQNYKKTWSEKENKDNDKREADIWVAGLKNFINSSSNIDEIKKLSDVFINYYDYNSDFPLSDEKWINEDKLQYVVDKKLINYLVHKVDPGLDDYNYKELLYFSSLKLIHVDDIHDLFIKLIESTDETVKKTNQEEAITVFLEKIILKIERISQLMSKVKPYEYKHQIKPKAISDYLNFLNQPFELQFEHPSYPDAPQYNQKVAFNFLNSISMNKEYQKKLLKFYLEVYRTTYNKADVISSISTLISKYSLLDKDFFELLIELRDKHNYTLAPLFNFLVEFNNLDSDLFNLYEKLFIQDNYKDSAKVIEKLNTLIHEYLSEENEVVESFLIAMLENISTKALITSIVTELSTEEIVLLPKGIQQLTYDYLCENDKLFEIEDKIDFIKEVLIFDKKYKDCIVKILVSKLQNKAKVKEALEILESLKHPSSENKSELYVALKKHKNHTKYSEEVSKYIEKYSTKESD